MTAREKFIKRLVEEGLYEEWCSTGDRAAKFLDDGSIILFIHYEWEPDDSYNELHYPPYEEMRNHESFRRECIDCFYDGDDEFVAQLARWLAGGEKCGVKCPLYPVDAYFPGSGLETKGITFEDDSDADEIIAMIQYIAERTRKEFHGIINGKNF